jgi:ATP-dependent protease HslVU (ClpYQ) peptidase subunit
MRKISRTCISIVKNRRGKLIMAGDRRVSGDWSFCYKCPYPKIKKKNNGILIGASGDSALCKLVVDIFDPPQIDVRDLEIYMYYKLLPDLNKLIKSQPGYSDEHKLLRIAPTEACSCLIGIKGRVFTVDINNPLGEHVEAISTLGRIIVDDAPIPYAIGCGSASSLPILLAEHNELGYNTREGLEKAMMIAAEISPGCSAEPFDFIQES